MFIAVYINTFHGQFEPYGPFGTEGEARRWITEVGYVVHSDRTLWDVFQVVQP